MRHGARSAARPRGCPDGRGRAGTGAAGDGVAWAINVAYADGVIARCSGHDAYPGGDEVAFGQFCRAVSRLTGGLEFGGERDG
jgi:hypothetical protein